MGKGFDTTENCIPHIASIKKHGYWVGRYSSHSAWKDMTVAEVKALSKAGIYIVNVWETSGDHEGYFTPGAGMLDGAGAYSFAHRIGQPFGTPIYFAVDCDMPTGEDIKKYFTSVRKSLEVHGPIGKENYRVGVYGSGDICRFLKSKGLVSYTWLAQSMGWSGSKTYKGWNIKQGPSTTLFGMDVDMDDTNGNGGGWLLKE